MLDTTKLIPAGIAAMILVLGAGGASLGAGEQSTSDDPLYCEIETSSSRGMTTMQGVVHSDEAISGSYRFRVKSSGSGGSSNIQQGGAFTVNPGEPTVLGRVMLGSRGTYDATLKITAGGKTIKCTGEDILLQRTDAKLFGYPQFKIIFDRGKIRNQWGRILCSTGMSVPGTFQFCKTNAATSVDDGIDFLSTTDVQLVLTAIKGADITVSEDTTFGISNTQFSLYTGCNTIRGMVETSGNSERIKFSDISATLIACQDGYEDTIISLLKQMNRYQMQNGRLTLSSPEGVSLVFTPLPSPLEKRQEEVQWVVSFQLISGGMTMDFNSPRQTVQFYNGTISGETGCGHYQASYENHGDRLRIGQITLDTFSCPTEKAREFHSVFLNNLGRVGGIHHTGGNQWVLSDDEGRELIKIAK